MAGKVVKQLAGSGTGQSLSDIMTAMKYTLSGSLVIKAICKATTEEMIAPKKKHLTYLVQCTFEPHLSIPDFANNIIDRTQHSNLVVSFKALLTIHHLMQCGSERFSQYLASNNCHFNGTNLSERSTIQAYELGMFIQPYRKYLDDKAAAYREVAFDFCRLKHGKGDSDMRIMSQEKLFKTIPVIEKQLDSLLQFNVTPDELSNPLLRVAHLLIYRDLIRLYAAYNEAMINLIGRYFQMSKRDCRTSLDIYRSFVRRMEGMDEFVRIAESTEHLSSDSNMNSFHPVPPSLLEALEQHLTYLESHKQLLDNKRVIEKSPNSPNNPTFPSVMGPQSQQQTSTTDPNISVSDLRNLTNFNHCILSDVERRKIIEEERCRLETFVSNARKHALFNTEQSLTQDNSNTGNVKHRSDSHLELSNLISIGTGLNAPPNLRSNESIQRNISRNDDDNNNLNDSLQTTTRTIDNFWSNSINLKCSSLLDSANPFSTNSVVPSTSITPAFGHASQLPSTANIHSPNLFMETQLALMNDTNPFTSTISQSGSIQKVKPDIDTSHSSLPNSKSSHSSTQQSTALVTLDDKIAQLAGDLSFLPVNSSFRSPDSSSEGINWTKPMSLNHSNTTNAISQVTTGPVYPPTARSPIMTNPAVMQAQFQTMYNAFSPTTNHHFTTYVPGSAFAPGFNTPATTPIVNRPQSTNPFL